MPDGQFLKDLKEPGPTQIIANEEVRQLIDMLKLFVETWYSEILYDANVTEQLCEWKVKSLGQIQLSSF